MDSGCYRRELFFVRYDYMCFFFRTDGFLRRIYKMQESSKKSLFQGKTHGELQAKKVPVVILFLVSSCWHRSWFLKALHISWNGPKTGTPVTRPSKIRRSLIGVTCGIILLRGRTRDLLVITIVFGLEWAYWALEKREKNEKNPSIWGVLRGEFVVFGRFDGRVFLIVFDSK